MTDARIALRSFAVYAICIPLALFLGYLLANPMDMGSFALFSVVLLVISAPILLRFHYPLMLLAWNSGMLLFFLPGAANLWLVAIVGSFAVAFSHHVMDKKVQFLSVPELTRPLLVLAAIVLGTGLLRGGFGMRAFGGEEVGGRRYIWLFVGILGYFALTTQTIQRDKAVRYVGLFLLGGAAPLIGGLYGILPPFMDFLFQFFPPSSLPDAGVLGGVSRFGGAKEASLAVFSYMLMRFGIRGMLAPGRKHLFVILCVVGGAGLFGGFRTLLVTLVMLFAFQFYWEGMLRTKWAAIFAGAMIMLVIGAAPVVDKLPLAIQRTLAVLPVPVNPQAKADAEGSTEWRLEMWRAALPDIPQYLVLGKGYLITRQDFFYMTDRAFHEYDVEERGAFIAGDYHNGPLSVIMPLGIWGVLAFGWFFWVGCRVLHQNYRYGNPALLKINTFLLAYFTTKLVIFLFVFGGVYADMVGFTGILGLSVALNGGVAKPAAAGVQPPGEIQLNQQSKRVLSR
jgi:hypothetical protein